MRKSNTLLSLILIIIITISINFYISMSIGERVEARSIAREHDIARLENIYHKVTINILERLNRAGI